MTNCFFCNPTNFGGRKLKLEDENGYWYLVVPDQIGSYGQILFIVSKLDNEKEHIKDISDPILLGNTKRLFSILEGISDTSLKLKKLKDEFERRVEKVYVLTQCEHVQHLHFHLIPRYEGDLKGNAFLYHCELEEARWKNDLKLNERMKEGKNILNNYKELIHNNKFFHTGKYKENTTNKIVDILNDLFKK